MPARKKRTPRSGNSGGFFVLTVRAAGGKIKHRFEYLLKMIQND